MLFNQAFAQSEAIARAGVVINVVSAGTNAVEGSPRCSRSSDITGAHVGDGSRELTTELMEASHLILATGKTQRGLIVKAAPRLRSRIFTLRECANLATYITSTGLALDAARGLVDLEESPLDLDQVPQLPDASDKRVTWFLDELDAWRGQNPLAPEIKGQDPLDIPDPHDAKSDIHVETFELLTDSVDAIVSALNAVLSC